MLRRRPVLYIPTPVSGGDFSHLNSIDFNGTNEVMVNTSNNDLSIVNSWTWMMWIKPTEVSFAADRLIAMVTPNPDNGVNGIFFEHFGDIANDPLIVSIFDSDGSTIKSYEYNNLIVGNVWQQLVLTWDGTTMILYKNGSAVTPSALTIDDPGTMTGTGRQVSIGARADSSLFWQGRAYELALWSTVLTAGEVTSIYNGGVGNTFDLSTVQGAALQHWWPLGTAGDIGVDLGEGTAIDLNANSANITEGDDVVVDSPS